MMKFSVLTLFPDFFDTLGQYSVLGRGLNNNSFQLEILNIREFASNKHKKVDDYSYGGGPGMIMQAQPIVDAIESVKNPDSHVIYLSPRGEKLSQAKLEELKNFEHLILLNGHYEGVDERVIEHFVDEEISIGDYVLSGGEIASMVLIDGVARLLDGVLSNKDSVTEESHSSGLLEYPQYTRPENFRGFCVPEVLLSGDHKKIEDFRHKKSLEITLDRRPDLIKLEDLPMEDRKYIIELMENKKEEENGHY